MRISTTRERPLFRAIEAMVAPIAFEMRSARSGFSSQLSYSATATVCAGPTNAFAHRLAAKHARDPANSRLESLNETFEQPMMPTHYDPSPALAERRAAHCLRILIGVIGLVAGVVLMSQQQSPQSMRRASEPTAPEHRADAALQPARSGAPAVPPSTTSQGT